MIYAKATLVGIVTAIAAAIIWIGIALVLPIFLPFLLSRFTNDGSGAAGAVVTSGSVLTAALAGFVLGFWKTVRRAWRRAG